MLRQYSSMLLIFARYQLLRDMQFKSSFLIRVLANLAEFSFMLIFFSVIYGNNLTVPGWTLPETFVLLATYQIINAIYSLMFSGIAALSYLVERGDLDVLLTKPIDTQFVVSCRHINYESIFGFIIAVVLLISSWKNAGGTFTVGSILVFCFLVLSGALLKYTIGFLLMSLSLRVTRIEALYYLFLDFFTISQYPSSIFGRLSKIVFSTVIPVAVVANVPASVLLHGLNWKVIILSLVITLTFFVFSRLSWLGSLKGYMSASS